MAKKEFKSGDKVCVVLADGKTRAPAEIKRMNRNGTADLELELGGQAVTITSSPFDETGTRADCWCEAAEEAKK